MGDKNITLEQLKNLAERADDRLDALEAGTPVRQTLTLSSDGWTNNSGDADYPYQYRLTVTGVTAASIADATLDSASSLLAYKCGLSEVTNTEADTVIFKSTTAPTANLTGVLDITRNPRVSGN